MVGYDPDMSSDVLIYRLWCLRLAPVSISIHSLKKTYYHNSNI